MSSHFNSPPELAASFISWSSSPSLELADTSDFAEAGGRDSLLVFFCTSSAHHRKQLTESSRKFTRSCEILQRSVRGKSHKITDFVETQCHTFLLLGRSIFVGDLLLCLRFFLSFFGWYLLVSFGLVIVFLIEVLQHHMREDISIWISICLHINKVARDEDGRYRHRSRLLPQDPFEVAAPLMLYKLRDGKWNIAFKHEGKRRVLESCWRYLKVFCSWHDVCAIGIA